LVSGRYLSLRTKATKSAIWESVFRSPSRHNVRHMLLAHPQATIAEVAFAAGFQSLTHFYRVFSRRYGLAPALWRRRQPPSKSRGVPSDIDQRTGVFDQSAARQEFARLLLFNERKDPKKKVKEIMKDNHLCTGLVLQGAH
jgi:hypothetical protein